MLQSSVFTIFTGNHKVMNLKAVYQESGDPLDLTSCSEIVIALPLALGGFLELTLGHGDVVIDTPTLLGKFHVTIESADSLLLQPGELQNFNVTFTIGVNIFTVPYLNALSVFEQD